MVYISVIVPLYHGKKFVPVIIEKVKSMQQLLSEKINDSNVELVFINDYPDEKIVIPETNSIIIKLFSHSKNKGIHQARVTGLENCIGNFVLFLDNLTFYMKKAYI